MTSIEAHDAAVIEHRDRLREALNDLEGAYDDVISAAMRLYRSSGPACDRALGRLLAAVDAFDVADEPFRVHLDSESPADRVVIAAQIVLNVDRYPESLDLALRTLQECCHAYEAAGGAL